MENVQSSLEPMQLCRDKDAALYALRWNRIQRKALLLSGWRVGRSRRVLAVDSVSTAECEECREMKVRMERIEQKLDALLQIRLADGEVPPWFKKSEERLLSALAGLADSFKEVSGTCGALRYSLSEMADGADRFLAGLKAKLTKTESELFFELIATDSGKHGRRIKSYSEIGARLGVSKQAVQKRYQKLCNSQPAVAEFIRAIRDPQKAANFSEISPRERRKSGIDESFGYDER